MLKARQLNTTESGRQFSVWDQLGYRSSMLISHIP